MKIGEKCPLCDWEAADKQAAKHEPGCQQCWQRIKDVFLMPACRQIMGVADMPLGVGAALGRVESAVDAARERARTCQSRPRRKSRK